VIEKEIIFLVEEAPEGGYQARALGHAIFTESDTFEELKKMAQDAVQCHFEPAEMPRQYINSLRYAPNPRIKGRRQS